jgi:transposase
MAKTPRFDDRMIAEAKELRDSHDNEREYRAALVFLYLAEEGRTAEQAAAFFGIGLRTVFADLDRIRKPHTVKKGVWGGGNNHLMSAEEERAFLAEFEGKADAGFIVTMPELHEQYNIRVGRQTPKSTFYRLLKRNNWRKALPDTRRPEGDPKIQEEFKKNHSKWKWRKLP